jgi:hypothetical protein
LGGPAVKITSSPLSDAPSSRARHRGGVGVGDPRSVGEIDHPVLREIRVEHDVEQPALAADEYVLGQAADRLGREPARRHQSKPRPGLLRDEHAAVGQEGHAPGRGQAVGQRGGLEARVLRGARGGGENEAGCARKRNSPCRTHERALPIVARQGLALDPARLSVNIAAWPRDGIGATDQGTAPMSMPVRILRILVAFVLAVVATYVIGSALYTQAVLSGLGSVGVEVPIGERLSVTAQNIVGMTDSAFGGFVFGFISTYPEAIVIGLVVAYAVATPVRMFVKPLAAVAYPAAGAVALLTIVYFIHTSLSPGLFAGARETGGLALQAVAGTLGGFVFALLLPRDQAEAV